MDYKIIIILIMVVLFNGISSQANTGNFYTQSLNVGGDANEYIQQNNNNYSIMDEIDKTTADKNNRILNTDTSASAILKRYDEQNMQQYPQNQIVRYTRIYPPYYNTGQYVYSGPTIYTNKFGHAYNYGSMGIWINRPVYYPNYRPNFPPPPPPIRPGGSHHGGHRPHRR